MKQPFFPHFISVSKTFQLTKQIEIPHFSCNFTTQSSLERIKHTEIEKSKTSKTKWVFLSSATQAHRNHRQRKRETNNLKNHWIGHKKWRKMCKIVKNITFWNRERATGIIILGPTFFFFSRFWTQGFSQFGTADDLCFWSKIKMKSGFNHRMKIERISTVGFWLMTGAQCTPIQLQH